MAVAHPQKHPLHSLSEQEERELRRISIALVFCTGNIGSRSLNQARNVFYQTPAIDFQCIYMYDLIKDKTPQHTSVKSNT
jgi:hypothetical protein